MFASFAGCWVCGCLIVVLIGDFVILIAVFGWCCCVVGGVWCLHAVLCWLRNWSFCFRICGFADSDYVCISCRLLRFIVVNSVGVFSSLLLFDYCLFCFYRWFVFRVCLGGCCLIVVWV